MIYKKNNLLYDFKNVKILYTTTIFDTTIAILNQNPKAIIISPLTNIKDLFEIKNNTIISNWLKENDIEDIINNQAIIKLNQKLEENFNDIIQIGSNIEKISKSILFISDKKINDVSLEVYLKWTSKYFSNLDIILIGFDQIFINTLNKINNLNILFITDNFQKLNLKFNLLELLSIETATDVIEIFDLEIFKNFLEKSLNINLSNNEIDNFLKNSSDYTTYLIQNTLKKM